MVEGWFNLKKRKVDKHNLREVYAQCHTCKDSFTLMVYVFDNRVIQLEDRGPHVKFNDRGHLMHTKCGGLITAHTFWSVHEPS